MSDDYPTPTDAGGYLRREAKRAMQQARRPSFRGVKEELGPGISPRATQTLDWNSEECTYNGYFYSVQGALSSPDPSARWLGEVWAQDDFNGVQTLREAQPPTDEVVEPDPDAPAPAVTPEDPEPEPPAEGNVTPIRAFTRYFSITPEGTAKYTDWEPVGTGSGGRLRDLSDVKIFDPLAHHDMILWDEEYNDGEGAWVNHSFVPGLHDLQLQLDDLLEEMEELIDIADAAILVFRQDEAPVPGVEPIPAVIPDGSIWFDTNDGYKMRVWDGGAWVLVEDAVLEGIQGQIDALADQVAQVVIDTAAVVTDMNEINTVTIPAIEAQAAQAVSDAADAIEAASLVQPIIGDNLIANGDFSLPATPPTDPPSLWVADIPLKVALSRWNSGVGYALKATVTGGTPWGTIYQGDNLGRVPVYAGQQFYVQVGAASLDGDSDYRLVAHVFDVDSNYISTLSGPTTQTGPGTSGPEAQEHPSSTVFTVPFGVAAAFVRFGIEILETGEFYFSSYLVAAVATTPRIADNAITETQIEDGAVNTPQLRANAVTANEIATNAVTTNELDAFAVTVKHTMVGPTYKTASNVGTGISPSVVPGILINSDGMVVYGNTGPTLTVLGFAGSISMSGALTSGSTVTGTDITGGTVTGALIQTVDTVSRGIKITNAGMTVYDGTGTPTLTVDANGNIAMMGSLTSGSTITGATINSPLIQTSTSPNIGIKFTNFGLVGYGAGSATFVLDINGALTVTGPVVAGGDINGATVTGGTVQSTATPNRGVKFNSAGLVAYTDGSLPGLGAGSATVTILASNGQAAFRGSITSGSTVTGAEVIGSMVRTSAAYSNAIHIGMSDGAVAGMKIYDGFGSMILYARPDVNSSTPVLLIRGGLKLEQAPNYPGGGLGSSLNIDNDIFQQSGRTFSFNQGVVRGALQCQSGLLSNSVTATGVVQGNNLEAAGHGTTGSNANCYIRPADGRLFRSTASARRFKTDITDLEEEVDVEAVVALKPVAFTSLLEADDGERFSGFIADEAVELGLDKWVGLDEDGEVETFNYTGFTVAQHVVLRKLWSLAQAQAIELDEVRSEMDEMRSEIAEIRALLPPGKTKK